MSDWALIALVGLVAVVAVGGLGALIESGTGPREKH
jgi:hypothetical protein